MANAKEKELSDLLEILDCFFDPDKKPVQPKPRFYPNNGQQRRQRFNSKSKRPNQERDKNENHVSEGGSTESPKEEPRSQDSIVISEEQQQPSAEVAVQWVFYTVPWCVLLVNCYVLLLAWLMLSLFFYFVFITEFYMSCFRVWQEYT